MRLLAAFIAWLVGWIIYFDAVYEGGVPAMLVQPVITSIVATVSLGLVLLLGLVIRIPAIHRLWHSTSLLAGSIVAVSLVLLCFGSACGLTESYTSLKTGHESAVLHREAAIPAYLLLMFAIANWPIREW